MVLYHGKKALINIFLHQGHSLLINGTPKRGNKAGSREERYRYSKQDFQQSVCLPSIRTQ